MTTVIYTAHDGTETIVEGTPGVSIMETALRNGVPGIVGECGGSMSCATCHVFVSDETAAIAGEMSELEDEMLDGTAVEREERSRLSCQIKLIEGETYRVTTPSEQV
ncbi:2Fe-2S iron-sulfur cluster-binding protein [Microcella alkalica]|uniref:2Fe-2S iron-sulfur cluster-binding protein n=1 Tax=Microcella alkalica TaxID=355930 RepID=UPI00145DB9A4|nr:2Fe-2S iron-sulfur cluster-binding protein [Microcella alkalica]